mmetsp:Transcript_37390/g.76750  ORF Transcript_37390/g.76750 Transcript_37390/m.76750 type:complete len:276 (-) Transcript_37390:104-931(-)|eukprot:CAMPEP_0181314556 /NCGR_PEP_ID=MMETSP1101-20121128/14886_1 /TAXON_ID=46948 /ORGANISM="Rhodomonas abbreviata, Strain Caron Lab Isolate" /LENGTH=275 /DNA_ID=CAMNT_0023421667 /DNA_START=103 /DNA_END=930 /DNA_ORIENTATION=-
MSKGGQGSMEPIAGEEEYKVPFYQPLVDWYYDLDLDSSALIAEFIGTFLFTWLGASCASNSVDAGLTTAAVGNGGALAVLIYSTARISGGHLNPAISLALFLIAEGEMTLPKFLGYTIMQLSGALLAAFSLRHLCPDTAVLRNPFVTQGILSDGVSRNLAGLGIFEFVMTFALVYVVCATALDAKGTARQYAPLIIGLTYTVGIYCEGPYTGGSMNPARTIAAAVVFSDYVGMWISLLFIYAGAVAGAFIYKGAYNIDSFEQADTSAKFVGSRYV